MIPGSLTQLPESIDPGMAVDMAQAIGFLSSTCEFLASILSGLVSALVRICGVSQQMGVFSLSQRKKDIENTLES